MDIRKEFLESYFQHKLEEANVFNASPNPEEEPYKNLYKARDIYKEILDDAVLKEEQYLEKDSEPKMETLDDLVNQNSQESKKPSKNEELHQGIVSLKAFLQYLLATNYFDTDENGLAIKFYNSFLSSLSRLPFSKAVHFFNYLQDALNKLGLVNLNSGEDDKGMAYLLKSKKLYEKLVEILEHEPVNSFNSIDEYGLELKSFGNANEEELSTGLRFRVYKPYMKNGKKIIN